MSVIVPKPDYDKLDVLDLSTWWDALYETADDMFDAARARFPDVEYLGDCEVLLAIDHTVGPWRIVEGGGGRRMIRHASEVDSAGNPACPLVAAGLRLNNAAAFSGGVDYVVNAADGVGPVSPPRVRLLREKLLDICGLGKDG